MQHEQGPHDCRRGPGAAGEASAELRRSPEQLRSKRTEKPFKNAERRLADAHQMRDDRMEYLIRIGRDSDERIAALIGVAVGLVHQARNRMAGKQGRSAGAP
jgi:hypothetical protein